MAKLRSHKLWPETLFLASIWLSYGYLSGYRFSCYLKQGGCEADGLVHVYVLEYVHVYIAT